MGLRDTFLNLLGADVQTNNIEAQKTSNQFLRSSRDFLKYGNREQLTPEWAEIRMSDKDMYRGYSYAVIQKRGNKVASLAKNNLSTWAKPEVIDEFQANEETVQHPYLKLIEDSTKFTEKQFWKNISIYLDLAGRYYLGAVRNQIQPLKEGFPVINTDITEFVMLNPYEIRRVINKDGVLAGYIERKKDGRYREWPVHQIIEMKELNPFDPDNSQWAITDAAKEAVYTLNQSGDYTRQSLSGNIDAPGIITTDLILNDEDFANFRSRVQQHKKGEPLFGNGAGSIKWDSMQIDLDKAALLDINEINRTMLFAVSGTSKTSLGIEQSGTTRETARVQSEQFVSDTAQPRLEDIADFLNLDYRKYYKREYKKTGYMIEVNSAVSRDYSVEVQATEMRQAQIDLAMRLMQSGYTMESAYQYAQGEIELGDLELEEGKDKPTPPDDMGGQDGGPNTPQTPNDPQIPQVEKTEEPTTSSADLDPNSELTPNADIQENSGEGEQSDPLEVLEVECNHEGECSCGGHDPKIDTYVNRLTTEDNEVLLKAYNDLLKDIREIQKEAIDDAIDKVEINSFQESDIITVEQKETLIEKLTNAFKKYWWLLMPLFGNNLTEQRNKEFNVDEKFTFTNELQNKVQLNASEVAKGHTETILRDILDSSNRAYTNVLESAAADLIVEEYKKNPSKFEFYFKQQPTVAQATKAIQNTDILETNRKIYDKANKMALDGFKRADIVKAIREEYNHLSTTRAETIARNETSRAFTQSQYQADYQFLKSINKLDKAYKQLYSRSGNPCKYCQSLINKGLIPFTANFLDKGEEISIVENGKTSTFKADYENITAGVVHVNCYTKDTSVYTDKGWKLFTELDGSEKFWSLNMETKSGEWVSAKNYIEQDAERVIQWQNKNIDIAVTPDHNMVVEVPHRVGANKDEKREYKLELVKAKDVKKKYRFYAGLDWAGEEPKQMKLGDKMVDTELYLKFMGYYLSEGSSTLRSDDERTQVSIHQEKHYDTFKNDLEKLPFDIWAGKNAFSFKDKSLYDYCSQFGKSYEKFIPEEIKKLSPRLLNIFLDAYILGDGSEEYSKYSGGVSRNIFTSSIRMRDDLTEVVQKAGYRPAFYKVASKGDQYTGTDYKINHDVWRIALNNGLNAVVQYTEQSEIEYNDKVYCVELEKNHTLFVERSGRCWWSGNCQCEYRLVFKGEDGRITDVYNSLRGEDNSNLLNDYSSWLLVHSNDSESRKALNGGAGSGNHGHSGRPGQRGGSGKGDNSDGVDTKEGQETKEIPANFTKDSTKEELTNKTMELVNQFRLEREKILAGAKTPEDIREGLADKNSIEATKEQLDKIDELDKETTQKISELESEYYQAKGNYTEPGYYKDAQGNVYEVVANWGQPDMYSPEYQRMYPVNASKTMSNEVFISGQKLEKASESDVLKSIQAGDTRGGISKQDERVIKTYTYATPQNSDLRKGVSISEIPSAKALQGIINRTKSETGTFYRGFQTKEGAKDLLKLKVGDTYSDKGFMSTDRTPEVAKNFATSNIMMKITNKGDSFGKNLSVSSYSLHPEENEVLFNAGTKMKVKNITKEGKFTVYEMEVK